MIRIVIGGLLCVLCGCAKDVPVPSDWATTVVRSNSQVHASCHQDHVLSEPQGSSGTALVRWGNAATDDYAKLKSNYEACATWAKGQRR